MWLLLFWLFDCRGMAFDSNNNLYTTWANNDEIMFIPLITSTGTYGTPVYWTSWSEQEPEQMVLDNTIYENLWVCSWGTPYYYVLQVGTIGVNAKTKIATWTGSGFTACNGIAVDSNNKIYFTQNGGIVNTIAYSSGNSWSSSYNALFTQTGAYSIAVYGSLIYIGTISAGGATAYTLTGTLQSSSSLPPPPGSTSTYAISSPHPSSNTAAFYLADQIQSMGYAVTIIVPNACTDYILPSFSTAGNCPAGVVNGGTNCLATSVFQHLFYSLSGDEESVVILFIYCCFINVCFFYPY